MEEKVIIKSNFSSVCQCSREISVLEKEGLERATGLKWDIVECDRLIIGQYLPKKKGSKNISVKTREGNVWLIQEGMYKFVKD